MNLPSHPRPACALGWISSNRRRFRGAAIVTASITFLIGCSSQLPRVRPPQFDPVAATRAMMAELDQNQDGTLSESESAACAGLANAWPRYDTNGDHHVTSDEMEARFRKWLEEDTGMMNVRAEVTWNRAPLTGAHVVLTPLPCFGDKFHTARGDTDRYGFVFLSVDKADLPSQQQGIFGMQVGLYRVEITHPTIPLPDRFHAASELGIDLSPAESNSGIAFHLKK